MTDTKSKTHLIDRGTRKAYCGRDLSFTVEPDGFDCSLCERCVAIKQHLAAKEWQATAQKLVQDAASLNRGK